MAGRPFKDYDESFVSLTRIVRKTSMQWTRRCRQLNTEHQEYDTD